MSNVFWVSHYFKLFDPPCVSATVAMFCFVLLWLLSLS